ncbi:MAG: hypothetical protein CL607_01135, partial [Anaerolineaceae bacterium]|nr:hypothetical protein [Anaerolineaceae bacterium]
MATYFDSSGVDLSGIVDGETIDANDVKLPLQALKDAVTDMDTMLGDGLVLDEQSTAPAAATGVVKLYVLGGKLYAKDANGQVYDLFSGGGTSTQAPIANAGADQTVQDSDDSGNESVILDGSGSSDGDGTIVSYVWTEGGSQIATGVNPTVNLAVGTHTITLTVTDNDNETATDTVVVTVNALSNQNPVANAGADQTVQDSDGSGSESIELDGSGSSDGDGTIVSYVWTEGGSQIATGVNPTVNLV